MSDLADVENATANGIVAGWTEMDLLNVQGPDAVSYLQGQLSQDVEGMADGEARWSFLLQPQGKVDAWFRIQRLATDHFRLVVDPGFGQSALARLERFKLRVDADMTLSTVPVLALRGPGVADVVEQLTADQRKSVVPTLWATLPGVDVVAADIDLPAAAVEADEVGLELIRITAGRPAMGRELDETTIPAAAGVVDLSVDFAKGCYVGQELVARIDSRGSNTPTSLVRATFPDGGFAGPGDALTAGEAEIGSITSAATSSRGGVAMAYVKRGVAGPGVASLTLSDGAEVEVSLLPLLDVGP
jgi:folate-binding protein YgfZ